MAASNHKSDTATRCVHAGAESLDAPFGVNTPVVTSTAYGYREDGQVRYPRYLNTLNHTVVARRMAALEGAEAALITASGMGACSAIFLTLMRPGEHAVLLEGLYGGTTDLAEHLLKPLGMGFSTWDGRPESLPGLIVPETRLLFVESPTNPLLEIIDLAATAATAHDAGIAAVIDNTFATPVLQQPLALGFDLVMHSGTKYLSGHSDLLCGAVAGRRERVEQVAATAVRLGAALNGQDLYLLERSLKTLDVRVRRQSANAAAVAAMLQAHDRVAAVRYPGLAGHPGHALAKQQMLDVGAMLSFHLAPPLDPDRFLDALKLITPAVSLGGVETTICQPSRTSHARLTAGERDRLGIDDRLMRLSVGVEAADELIADLNQALQPD